MEALKKLIAGKDLTRDEASHVMQWLMDGKYTPSQMAGYLVALAIKGETADELSEFAKVMRKHAAHIEPNVVGELVDTCGTGGDSSHTFNISTCAALIAAGSGVPIAKHGNRSVSGKSGSSDALEELGVKSLHPENVKICIEKTGFGFMFAPFFHPATKNVMPVRRELGVRTMFNILGPLTNPAGAQCQVLGVFDDALIEKLANVLLLLGTRHALVVKSEKTDEFGLGITKVCEVKGGKIERYEFDAKSVGFEQGDIPTCNKREESAKVILGVLSGEKGPARDVSVLNAGAAIYVSGKAPSIAEGVEMAKKSIDSGSAKGVLNKVVEFCKEV